MLVMPKVRICGNCAHNTANRATGVLIKSFKCDIDMRWCAYDEVCDAHHYENEEPVVPKKSGKKTEAIDLGGIPDNIRGDIPNAPT